MHFSVKRLARSLKSLEGGAGGPPARVCVAVSGGIDSLALLHSAAALASAGHFALRALHIDHGLQQASAGWAAHCRQTCDGLAVPFGVLSLRLVPAKGVSVEAAARDARYAALSAQLQPGEWLLTAHHQDDQFETVLLQLLRGAGVAGLAAMPGLARLGPGWHARPLLDERRAALEAYALAAGLEWIEDPMNAELRYERAYLRQELSPWILARWPAAGRTVARSARHLADAQVILAEVAAADARLAVDAEGRLDLGLLLGLSVPRQRNLLRAWLDGRGLGLPSTARLEAILRDLVPARADATPVVTWPSGEVRRYRGRLYGMSPLGPPPTGWSGSLEPGQEVELPSGLGWLSLEGAADGGIACSAVSGQISVRFGASGQSLRLSGRQGAHSIRNLFQEAGVVPWMRPRLPILVSAGRTLAIAGVGVAGWAAAPPGSEALSLRWRASPPLR